ncbi:MAG TPA: hypothetical protein VMS37_24910 [Verrucomicrobiae bacterium]|nr:hypothetical protein [Verrucomicrobiae bacterium]
MGPLKSLLKRRAPPGTAVQTCPLTRWELTVNLTREAKPAQCNGQSDIELDDSGVVDWDNTSFGAATARRAEFQGDHNQTLTVTATAPNDSWYCVAPATVSVVLGQKKSVTLHFKPKPWVKFKVVDDDTKAQLAGLTLKFTLPSGQQTRVTVNNATSDALKLDPADNTCAVDELDNTADTTLWEFVRIDTES